MAYGSYRTLPEGWRDYTPTVTVDTDVTWASPTYHKARYKYDPASRTCSVSVVGVGNCTQSGSGKWIGLSAPITPYQTGVSITNVTSAYMDNGGNKDAVVLFYDAGGGVFRVYKSDYAALGTDATTWLDFDIAYEVA
jgi:hypothetical protein